MAGGGRPGPLYPRWEAFFSVWRARETVERLDTFHREGASHDVPAGEGCHITEPRARAWEL